MMKKRWIAFFICVTCLSAALAGTIHAGGDAKSYALDLTGESVNAQGQFSAITMTVRTLRDGNVSVGYDLTISDEYLARCRNLVKESTPGSESVRSGFPERGSFDSDAAYQAALKAYNDEYYRSLEDDLLPTIRVDLTYDRKVFSVPDKDRRVKIEYTDPDGEKEKVGEGEFSMDANGHSVFTMKFDKVVYNRSNVAVSFSLEYLLNLDLSSGEALKPVWAGGIVSGEIEDLTATGSVIASDIGLAPWIIGGVVIVAAVAAIVIVKKKRA